MAKQRILIIVVTRADIPRGRGDDEFIEDWGQGKEQNIYWLDDCLISAEYISFLVLHGCDDNKKNYPRFFQKAIEEKGADSFKKIDKMYLCYHGTAQDDLRLLQDNIRKLLKKGQIPTTLSYSSSNDAHNFAIFDLLNQLEGTHQLTGIREQVLNQLQGRLVFIHQLHCLQSELLRLQFCIATIVSISNDSKQPDISAIENARNAVSEITKVLQREGFKTYYDKKIKLQINVKENIQALFDLFLKPNDKKRDSLVQDNLQEGDFWKKSLEEGAYKRLSNKQLPSLERDFSFLARAVDCLLDAASIDTAKKQQPQKK